MTLEDYYFLMQPTAAALIAEGEGMDPSRFALKLRERDLPAAAIASQVKYRERAKEKLPSWYGAGCIFEGQAFEQSTSEAVAGLKPFGKGERALDLTCGLGVDTYALSQRYREVTALEADRLRFMLARHNLELLGADNVTVWHSDAESWIKACANTRFDLVYVDPDRRDAQGKRLFRFADTSPNVVELFPRLLLMAPRVLIKASPMLDIDAALKELNHVHGVVVVAVDGECKELLFELRGDAGMVPERAVIFLRQGKSYSYTCRGVPEFVGAPLPSPGRFIYEADISLYKAKLAPAWFRDEWAVLGGHMNHADGYLWSDVRAEGYACRAFEVVHTMAYKPDMINKYLKEKGIGQINLTRRHFDLPLEQVRTQLKAKEGGRDYLLLTQWKVDGEWKRMAFHARRLAQ